MYQHLVWLSCRPLAYNGLHPTSADGLLSHRTYVHTKFSTQFEWQISARRISTRIVNNPHAGPQHEINMILRSRNSCHSISKALSRSPIFVIRAPTAAFLVKPILVSSFMLVDCLMISDKFARNPDIAKAAAIPNNISCFSCPADMACKTRAWKRSEAFSLVCSILTNTWII